MKLPKVSAVMMNGTTTASFPKVQFDLERHDPDWIAQCLTRWREASTEAGHVLDDGSRARGLVWGQW